jgi:hypothetical protein
MSKKHNFTHWAVVKGKKGSMGARVECRTNPLGDWYGRKNKQKIKYWSIKDFLFPPGLKSEWGRPYKGDGVRTRPKGAFCCYVTGRTVETVQDAVSKKSYWYMDPVTPAAQPAPAAAEPEWFWGALNGGREPKDIVKVRIGKGKIPCWWVTEMNKVLSCEDFLDDPANSPLSVFDDLFFDSGKASGKAYQKYNRDHKGFELLASDRNWVDCSCPCGENPNILIRHRRAVTTEAPAPDVQEKPKPAPELPKPPFYLVWCKGNLSPQMQHPIRGEAAAEARRIAEKQPGSEVYVLAPISLFKGTIGIAVTHYDNISDGSERRANE